MSRSNFGPLKVAALTDITVSLSQKIYQRSTSDRGLVPFRRGLTTGAAFVFLNRASLAISISHSEATLRRTAEPPQSSTAEKGLREREREQGNRTPIPTHLDQGNGKCHSDR